MDVGGWDVREKLLQLVRERAEVVVLVLLLCVSLGLRLFQDVGPGVYLLGLTTGAGLALQAIGIVVVYRANRVINFAQVEMGLLAGAIFQELVRNRLLLLGLRRVCPPCLPGPRTVADLDRIDVPSIKAVGHDGALVGLRNVPISRVPDFADFLPKHVTLDDLAVRLAPGWLVQVNYWLSMILAFGAAILASWAVYSLIIRRFERAPRVITTVLTIGLAEVFVLARDVFVRQVSGSPENGGRQVVFGANAAFPFDWRFKVQPTTFGTTEIMTVLACAAVLVGLTLFFTRSAIGVVLRGAAENPDRAQTLGVNVRSVNGVVWVMAGGLSAIASILLVTGSSFGGGANQIRFLTAAVIAGFTSIPMAAAAAIAVGVADESFSWVLRGSGLVDGLMLLLIVVVLLSQRARRERVDTDDSGWSVTQEMRPIPAELRRVEVVTRWVTSAKVIGAIALLALPWILSPAQTNLGSVTLIFGIVALSLLVLTGWAGQISLGHFAFAAMGAWFTAAFQWPFPLSIIFGGLLGAAAALVLGIPSLRLRGLHLAVTTLAFAVATSEILLSPQHLGSRLPATLARPSIIGLDLDDQRTFYYFSLAFLVLCFVGVVGLRRSRLARALMASRENEASAQVAGINLLRARLTAFAVSGFMAGFAGGLFAFSQYGVNIASFGPDQSIKMFLMVVIGGLGSVAGPLIGAAYIGIADIIGRSVPLFGLLATGVGTVVVLLFMPGGLGEVCYRIRDTMLCRVADRYHIDVPSLAGARRGQRGRRAPIGAKTRPGGGTVFVPTRYELDDQWLFEARVDEAARG
jgi:branched-chain amino acid transport system permease protein